MKRAAPPITLWLALAAGLSLLTGRISDWFVMTDELLYERLALSIASGHSPVPRVHGVVVANVNQLYPLVLAPEFAWGTVAHGLHLAHVVNAIAMTSSAIPAYLLAWRVTQRVWASSLAAVLTVVTPWIVLSSFLLTGAVAYPAFVWALLAFDVAIDAPSRRHDVLAVIALLVAVLARTQFVVLGIVLAVLVGHRWRAHRPLVAVYAAGALLAVLLLLTGHNPLGTYESTVQTNPFPPSIVPAVFAHLATLGVGVGILPFVVGGAWLVRRERFATLGLVTIALLAIETASYDERFGGGIVRDRYLFYLAPIFAVAFAAALASWERPSWRLLVPVGFLTAGAAVSPLPVFDKFNVDTPASVVNGYLRAELGGLTGARIFLIAVTLVCAGLVAEASILLARRAIIPIAILALVITTAQTAYAWDRLLRIDGTAGRSLTADPSVDQAWVDRATGRGAIVTAIPYPIVAGDYWASAAYWWDIEFWNVSVQHSLGLPGTFEWTPSTFPKLAIELERTGRANVSPPGLVLQAVADARFHIAGTVVTNNRGVFLVDPEQPWRADWSTRGLYADGWTRPGQDARIRVFGYPGQEHPVIRTVTVSVFAPPGVRARPFTVGATPATAGENEQMVDATVCVPPRGFAEIPVHVTGSSTVYGAPTTDTATLVPRKAGVQIARVYLSGEIGADCR